MSRIAYYLLGAVIALVPLYFMGLILTNLYAIGFDSMAILSIALLQGVLYYIFIRVMFYDLD